MPHPARWRGTATHTREVGPCRGGWPLFALPDCSTVGVHIRLDGGVLQRSQEMEGPAVLLALPHTPMAAPQVTTSGTMTLLRIAVRGQACWCCWPKAALQAVTSGAMARRCNARKGCKACWCCRPLSHALMAVLRMTASCTGAFPLLAPARYPTGTAMSKACLLTGWLSRWCSAGMRRMVERTPP